MMFNQGGRDIRTLAVEIAGELSQEESVTLVYLCLDFVKDYSAIGEVKQLFEILSKQNLLKFDFLTELLYRIRRFDILRRMKVDLVCFERSLRAGQGYVSLYRLLMMDISENLSQEDLQSIVFLLHCQVPKGRQEAVKTFLDLVVDLEKLGKIDVNNLEVVEDCLQTIGRMDLKKKILKYKQMGACAPSVRRSDAYQNVIPISVPCQEHGFERTQVSTLLPVFRSCNKDQLLRQHVHSNCSRSSEASSEEHHSETLSNPVPETAQASAPGTECGVQQNVLEKYRMQSTPLGLCLIIDCIGTDADLLKETFEALQFRVLLHLYVELDDLKQILRDTSERNDLAALDCFVCCIVSRGTPDSILAINGNSLRLSFEQIQQYFKGQSCRPLLGKPRLFFIQDFLTATSDSDDELETDTAWSNGDAIQADGNVWEEVVPQEADILWSCCQVSERLLYQAPQQPSSFMRTLSECLRKHQHRFDLVSVLTEVNKQTMLRNRRLTGEEPAPLVLRHTLRKMLIFP
ncbi:CASP8 and FADD-like apoptosis regulator isoform X2 [Heterodontus francisci]|uniref:CASP8 and FADD-like apoptosis regulator isoform X2 n=1 Tax=Heterodontus francisci TaxID=7792 RepID=UPI00355AD376